MKDLVETLNEFAWGVADALNVEGVTPAGEEDDICAVMVIVGDPKKGAPIGASLNYDKDKKLWDVQVEASLSEPVE